MASSQLSTLELHCTLQPHHSCLPSSSIVVLYLITSSQLSTLELHCSLAHCGLITVVYLRVYHICLPWTSIVGVYLISPRKFLLLQSRLLVISARPSCCLGGALLLVELCLLVSWVMPSCCFTPYCLGSTFLLVWSHLISLVTLCWFGHTLFVWSHLTA